MTALPRCTHAPQGAAARAAAALRGGVPVLRTARLILRAPEAADFPLWARIFALDEAGFIGGPMPPREAWDEFCVYVANWLLQGHGLWAVTRRDDDRLLGFVHLGLEWEDDEPELGWLFAPEACGKGYATEAAMAARDHATGLLGAGAFVSYTDPANTRSSRLAARLGAARDALAETAIADDTQVWRHGGSA